MTIYSEAPKSFESYDQFIFPSRLDSILSFFMSAPESVPQVCLFHGHPGVGKTSFGVFQGEKCAGYLRYMGMNESLRQHKELQDLRLNSKSLLSRRKSDERHLAEVTVMDEFHNLSFGQQDIFKLKLSSLAEDQRVIICANTTNKAGIDKVISPAILSRCHAIDFNIYDDDLSEVAEKALKQFSLLTRHEVMQYMPDYRRMAREQKLRESMSKHSLDTVAY